MADTPSANFNTRTAVLLGFILVIAGALRLWHIGRESFWLDEFLAVEHSNGHGMAHMDLQSQRMMESPPDFIQLDHARPWSSIWTESGRDIHPPLFYLLLRIWRMIVPDTDVWMRGLSVLLSLVAIVLLYLSVSVVGGNAAGLWASLLMALAGPQISYAMENRNYMLLLATLLGACAALLRIERFGYTLGRAVALGLCALAAALTHYAALPIIAMMGFYVLLRLRDNARKGAIAALFAAALLFAVIWGPFAIAQWTRFPSQVEFTRADSQTHGIAQLQRAALLPLRFFATTSIRTTQVGYFGAALYFLPLLVLRRRPELLFWWLWLIVGVGAVLFSDLSRNGQALNWIKYTLAATPAAYALAAMLLAHMSGWTRHLVPMTLALSSILALEGAYDPSKPVWREMAQYIDTHFQPGDVLIIGDLDEEHWPARTDLMSLNFYTHTAPIVTAIMDQPPSPQLREQLLSARRIWVFTNGMRTAADMIFPASRLGESRFVPGVGTMVRVEFQTPDALPAPQPFNVPALKPVPPSTAPGPVALR